MADGQAIRAGNLQQPVNLIEIAKRNNVKSRATGPGQTSFKQMFSEELAQERHVTFSRHAQERLYSRGLELSEQNLTDLAGAIDRAQTKGSKETLVLTDEIAFVVAPQNRTVVTVFDRENLREGVVTSIDSAVIV